MRIRTSACGSKARRAWPLHYRTKTRRKPPHGLFGYRTVAQDSCHRPSLPRRSSGLSQSAGTALVDALDLDCDTVAISTPYSIPCAIASSAEYAGNRASLGQPSFNARRTACSRLRLTPFCSTVWIACFRSSLNRSLLTISLR